MPDSLPEDVVEQDSTSGNPTESTAQTPTNSDATATSSTAEKPAETILDRVKSTLTKTYEESPTSKTSGAAADADPAKTAEKPGEPEGLPDDEAKTLHPKTKERFGKLTSELKTTKAELEKLKPQAAEYDKIDTFIRNANLTPQEVGGSLQIAALLRSDPQAARERLRPVMAELDRMLGETLPPALQARVDQGMLTLEDAKALNRASATADLQTRRAEAAEQRRQQDAESRNQQTQIDSTLDAVSSWEKQKAKGDPDWHQKQPEIAEQVELAIERKTRELGKPYWPTPEEAIKLSEDALSKIGDRYKRFTPKPRAIDPPVTAGASPRSTPAPKNTLDIVKQLSARTG